VSKATTITFHVPASAANLGPGYGVIAVALDLPLAITVEPRDDDQIVIERRDDPGAQNEDSRHDPVLRGLRAGAELLSVPMQKGVTVIVEGTIPRGAGLGTISAGFAAGLGVAARLAKNRGQHDQILDALVPLCGDPAHGAASLAGGLVAAVPLSQPQESERRHCLVQFPVHPEWQFVVVLPDQQMGTADTKRVLPPTLPHGVAARSTGRTIGVLQALSQGDAGLLRDCLFDEVHVPYRRRLVPGMEEALHAGVAAGAAGTTICGHGPGLIAITRESGRTQLIAKAMVAAFAGAGRHATSLVLNAAHYGALPRKA